MIESQQADGYREVAEEQAADLLADMREMARRVAREEIDMWVKKQSPLPSFSFTRAARVYLSGPMSGLPDLNSEAFYAAEQTLRRMGYEVLNPARLDAEYGEPSSRLNLVARDLKALLSADVIAVLAGWGDSLGVTAELAVAQWLGLPVLWQLFDGTFMRSTKLGDYRLRDATEVPVG